MTNVISKLSWKTGVLLFAVFAVGALLVPKSGDVAKSESNCTVYDHPILNPFEISYGSNRDGCNDSPPLEFFTPGGSYHSLSELQQGLTAHSGDEFYVQAYVHNGAAQSGFPDEQTIARNVHADFVVPTNSESQHNLGVTISGTDNNGQPLNTIQWGFSVYTNANEHLEVVADSGKLKDIYGHDAGGASVSNGNFSVNLGDMHACFEFARYIRFKVRVVADQSTVTPPPAQGTGTITASQQAPCSVNGTVDWQTSNLNNVQVWVEDTTDHSSRNLLGAWEHGPATFNWLTLGHDYLFTLTADGGFTQTATLHADNTNCGGTPPPAQGTGTITASQDANCSVNGTVNWQTSNLNNVQVWVQDVTDHSSKNLLAAWETGPAHFDWLTLGHDYEFTLTADGGFSKVATLHVNNQNCGGTPQQSYNITFTYGDKLSGQCLATGTITWTSSNVNNVKVYVVDPVSGKETEFGNGATGTGPTPWLNQGYNYTFILRGDGVEKRIQTGTIPNLNCGTTPVVQPVQCTASNSNPNIGELVTFTASQGESSSYSWSFGNVRVGTGATYAMSFSQAGDQTVRAISGNSFADCIVHVRATQTFSPVVCTPGIQNVQSGTPVSFNASQGDPSKGYTWTSSNGQSGSGLTFNTTYTNNLTTDQFVFAVVTNGTQQATCQVKVSPVVVTPQQITCVANPNPANTGSANMVTFAASPVSAGPFSWTLNGGTNFGSNGNSISGYFANAGTYTAQVRGAAGQTASCNVVVSAPIVNPVCVVNTNGSITADAPFQSGSSYSSVVRWQSRGNNGIILTMNGTDSVVTSGGANGFVQVNNLQPGNPYTFYIKDVLCGNVLASYNLGIQQTVNQNTTGGCTNNTNSPFSCNTQSNNNNQNSTGNYSPNQNNNSNINGNNNTVTQTNNNCVNNSCNNVVNGGNTYYVTTAGTTVPANEYRQLAIEKMVRSVNGGSFQNSVSVNNNDTVEFQITVRNSGNVAINNVRVSDSLPSGLTYVSGTSWSDSGYSSDSYFYGNSLSLGTLNAGASRTVRFQARVNSNQSASLQNIAYASGDNASQVQASAWVFVNPGNVAGGNVNLTYSKKAFNETKGVDATSQNASKEDYITYTLTVTNSGNAPATNFVITDDLSQVLPYADMVDNGGATVSGNVITYPGITIPAGGSVSKSFKVRVKYFLASNLSYVMNNTYGNTVTIRINAPQVAGAFIAPKTGADTLAFGFAGLVTAAFAVLKKRKFITDLVLNN